MILYGFIPQMPWTGPPLPRGLQVTWRHITPPWEGPPLPRAFDVKWKKK